MIVIMFIAGIIKIMFQGVAMEKRRSLSFYAWYSILWAALALMVFAPFITWGRSAVWLVDGAQQHYPALVYYSEYLIGIFSRLLSGDLSIPRYDIAIGEGGDIFGTLNYYVIGDPFAALSVFVPAKYMYVFYTATALLRCYLSGISFHLYSKYVNRKKNADIASVVASLTYAFGFWTFFNITRHPFFMNPLVFLPLILLGVEKVIRKDKPFVLIFSVFIAAVSNFYFFYMLVLVTVIYTAVRLVAEYRKQIREMLLTLLKIFVYALAGTLMSGAALYPAIKVILDTERLGHSSRFSLFFGADYYKDFLMHLTYGESDYLCIAAAVPVLAAITLMFFRKGHVEYKIFAAAAYLMVLFTPMGKLFNAMSYPSNRWTLVFPFIGAFAVEIIWDEIKDLSRKKICIIEGILAAYLIVCLVFANLRQVPVIAAAVFGMIFFALAHAKTIRFELGGTVVFMLSLVIPGFWYFASFGDNFVSQCAPGEWLEDKILKNEATYIKDNLSDGGFFRYSSDLATENAGFLHHISSSGSYWSVLPQSLSEMRIRLGVDEYITYKNSGYDSRATMEALSSTRIIARSKDAAHPLPYGFEKAAEEGSYTYYRSENAMPFGYTYDKAVSPELADGLSALELQDVMTEAAVIEGGDSGFEAKRTSEVVFEPLRQRDIEFMDNKISALKKEGAVALKAPDQEKSEFYLVFKGMEFKGEGNPDMLPILIEINKEIRTFCLYTEDFQWYNGRDSFVVNLGYFEEAPESVSVYFGVPGEYSFEKFGVAAYSLDGFENDMAALKAEAMTDVVFGDDTISGEITVTGDKFLVMSLPYSPCWSLEVDGKPAELYQANLGYSGTRLEAGSHKIELKYSNPDMTVGLILSISGLALTLPIVIFFKRKKNL